MGSFYKSVPEGSFSRKSPFPQGASHGFKAGSVVLPSQEGQFSNGIPCEPSLLILTGFHALLTLYSELKNADLST